MAVYSNPIVAYNATTPAMFEYLSMSDSSFHYDISYIILDGMNGVAPHASDITGDWHGHSLQKGDYLFLKEIIVTKNVILVFDDGGGNRISFSNIATNPILDPLVYCMIGTGKNNVNNHTVPTPFVPTDFYQSNYITYRLGSFVGSDTTYKYDINSKIKLGTSNNYINTSVWANGFGTMDLTNYITQVLVNYANYIVANCDFYLIYYYNIHLTGYMV